MILVGYIAEFIIICLWYRWILKDELKRKNIIKRSINNVYKQKRNIISYFVGYGTISEEQKKYFNNIKNCLETLLMETGLFVYYVLLGPILLKVLTIDKKIELFQVVFYTGILCYLIFTRLREDTQRIAKIINKYTEGVMIPLEKKPQLLWVNDAEKIIIKWDMKKVLTILVCLTISLILIVVTEMLKDSKLFHITILVLTVFILIKDSNIIKKKSKIVIHEGIRIYGDILESIQADIVDMCNQLKISTLECKITYESRTGVESKINKDGIPQVEIAYDFIGKIYNYDAKDILLITIAHELGHIYYKDFSKVRKRLKIALSIQLLLNILLLLGVMISIRVPLIAIIILLFFLIESALGKIMCDVRYWEQIAELRADRLAIQVCKGNKIAFIDFWKQYSKNGLNENTNIISQFYRRYVKIEGHPSMKRRMELLEKRDRWYWWEYFEHALIIARWRITNKGWNGI